MNPSLFNHSTSQPTINRLGHLHLPQTGTPSASGSNRFPWCGYRGFTLSYLLCTGICFVIGFLAFGGLACGIPAQLSGFGVPIHSGS